MPDGCCFFDRLQAGCPVVPGIIAEVRGLRSGRDNEGVVRNDFVITQRDMVRAGIDMTTSPSRTRVFFCRFNTPRSGAATSPGASEPVAT